MPSAAPKQECLSCRVRVTFFEHGRPFFDALSARHPSLPYAAEGEIAFDVLVDDRMLRLTMLSASNAPSWTIVRESGTRAASIWDHEQRFWLQLPHEDMATVQVAPATEFAYSSSESKEGTTADLRFFDAALGRCRQTITFVRRPDMERQAAALFRALYGGRACHATSRFPVDELAALGCIAEASTFVGDSSLPVSRLVVEDLKLISCSAEDFRPPKNVAPHEQVRPAERFVSIGEALQPPDETETAATERLPLVGQSRSALIGEEPLTPDCLGSTRAGSMAAVLHQDLLTHASTAINTAAPLLGTATLTAGTLTLNWLGALGGLSPTAPGSGIFCLLRDPRIPSTTPGGPKGGNGLLDRLAFRALTTADAAGMTRLQREFAASTLTATLTSWGVSATLIAKLVAASGDLRALTADERIAIFEAYETMDVGMVRIAGLPTTLGPFVWRGLISVGVTGIAGTMAFTSLGATPLVAPASIGSSANVTLGVMIPTTTLTATLTRALTLAGWGVLGASVVSCVFLPFSCAAIATLATLLAFVLNNVTALTATTAGAGITLDIAYAWNPATSLVEPTVNVVSTAGSITVTSTAVTPNIIANLFDSVLLGVANLFNAWLTVLAGEAAKALQKALRDNGFSFPVSAGSLGLSAVSGSATSIAGTRLTLSAEVQPVASAFAQPYVTQVPDTTVVTSRLETCQFLMRQDLNPGPGTAVGVYAGLAMSQNAINYYIFSQWRRGAYTFEITDPTLIMKLVALLPAALPRVPARIHVWPAVCPRVEVAEGSIAALGRPLVTFFDDLRICLEMPPRPGGDSLTPAGLGELSCNLKTTSTLTLEYPQLVRLRFDIGPAAIETQDARVWEWVDLNVATAMNTFNPAAWTPFVAAIGSLMLAANDASQVAPAPLPPAWNRPLPGGGTQEIIPSINLGAPLVPQSFYMEILGHRRTMYMLTALRTALLEFVDGSGAPLLNAFFGLAPGTISLGTMNCATGRRFWPLLGGLGPPFPGP